MPTTESQAWTGSTRGGPSGGNLVAQMLVAVVAVVLVGCAETEGDDSSSRASRAGAGSLVASGAPSASTAPSAIASAEPSDSGLTEAAAVSIARHAAAPDLADGVVRNAEAGPLAEVFPAMEEFEWSRDIPQDRWVWSVFLVTDESQDENAAMIFLDYVNGTVYYASSGFAD